MKDRYVTEKNRIEADDSVKRKSLCRLWVELKLVLEENPEAFFICLLTLPSSFGLSLK